MQWTSEPVSFLLSPPVSRDVRGPMLLASVLPIAVNDPFVLVRAARRHLPPKSVVKPRR